MTEPERPKRCTRCRLVKVSEMFAWTRKSNGNAPYRRSWCRPCHTEYRTSWQKAKRSEATKAKNRAKIKAKYWADPEHFRAEARERYHRKHGRMALLVA